MNNIIKDTIQEVVYTQLQTYNKEKTNTYKIRIQKISNYTITTNYKHGEKRKPTKYINFKKCKLLEANKIYHKDIKNLLIELPKGKEIMLSFPLKVFTYANQQNPVPKDSDIVDLELAKISHKKIIIIKAVSVSF